VGSVHALEALPSIKTVCHNSPTMQEIKIPWEQTVEWARIVAGCVVHRGGKYLLVQESNPRAYGLWNLPAGHVDKDEVIEHAAIREAKEETGYKVELDGKIGIYHEDAKRPVKHAFRAHVVGGKMIASSDEVLQVQWLAFAEIKALHDNGEIRAEWIWEAINTVEASLDQ